MRTTSIFKGVGTALVTPFTETGVDYPAFERLINWQIESGINALIICGTTGESSTMDDAEHREVLEFALKVANGRVPMVAGTGSNDTRYAMELTKHACEIGYDGVLVVTPYYNKTTQPGLIAMFTAIADVATKPVILYNVPSRTGINIAPATCAVLAQHPMIAAIKEASGNVSQVVEMASLVNDHIDIYSGNDDEIIPILSVGGQGVISVLSNVCPKETVEMCDKWFAGDVVGARELQLKYLPLCHALFSQVNPIPAKAAVSAMGFGENIVRLPLVPMEGEAYEKLLTEMRNVGIEV